MRIGLLHGDAGSNLSLEKTSWAAHRPMKPMPPSNLDRMIQLAKEFFALKNDPAQISVTEETMEKFREIHPATLTEENDGSGPVAWILLIPTTHELMEQFIAKQITERELLEKTPLQGRYDALYLCSALVLPEYRAKGLAKQLTRAAVKSIRADHPIERMFYWAFSPEGKKLAASVAREADLPLYSRPE